MCDSDEGLNLINSCSYILTCRTEEGAGDATMVLLVVSQKFILIE